MSPRGQNLSLLRTAGPWEKEELSKQKDVLESDTHKGHKDIVHESG